MRHFGRFSNTVIFSNFVLIQSTDNSNATATEMPDIPNKRGRVNRNENYRIIILPWPAYTDAFKTNANIKREGGGNLIEGKSS